jgi:hypothetical protein
MKLASGGSVVFGLRIHGGNKPPSGVHRSATTGLLHLCTTGSLPLISTHASCCALHFDTLHEYS